MASSFLTLPPPNSFLLTRRSTPPLPPPPPLLHHLLPSKPARHLTLCYSSPASASQTPYPVITEEDSSPAPARPPAPATDEISAAEADSDADGDATDFSPDFRGCKTCGRVEIENGCNGEGRIQGGIATVPGFGWWPIKAFRPCPAFVASGGRYRRQGQSMDEVAFGRGGRKVSVKSNKGKLSKKKEGSKRLKS